MPLADSLGVLKSPRFWSLSEKARDLKMIKIFGRAVLASGMVYSA